MKKELISSYETTDTPIVPTLGHLVEVVALTVFITFSMDGSYS